MATIRGLTRNSHGFWQFRPSGKGLPPGAPLPKRIALGTKDENEAIRMVLELRRDEIAPMPDGSRTIKQWIPLYLDDRRRVGKHRDITSRQTGLMLAEMAEYFGRRDIRRIDAAEVMAWYASLQTPTRTPAAIHKHYRVARALFYWLMRQKAVQSNPFAKLDLPAPKQSRREQFCTPEQREALLDACDREDLRFVLMCGFFLGMRINEIVNAKWGWFSVTGRQGLCTITSEVNGFKTKTGRSRQVPLHKRFLDYFNTLPRGLAAAYCLQPDAVQGKSWLRWDARRPWRELVASVNLPWVTFHTMRHTFGSLHASAGTAEFKIIRWMGITKETFDKHYAGLLPDHEAVNAI